MSMILRRPKTYSLLNRQIENKTRKEIKTYEWLTHFVAAVIAVYNGECTRTHKSTETGQTTLLEACDKRQTLRIDGEEEEETGMKKKIGQSTYLQSYIYEWGSGVFCLITLRAENSDFRFKNSDIWMPMAVCRVPCVCNDYTTETCRKLSKLNWKVITWRRTWLSLVWMTFSDRPNEPKPCITCANTATGHFALQKFVRLTCFSFWVWSCFFVVAEFQLEYALDDIPTIHYYHMMMVYAMQ